MPKESLEVAARNYIKNRPPAWQRVLVGLGISVFWGSPTGYPIDPVVFDLVFFVVPFAVILGFGVAAPIFRARRGGRPVWPLYFYQEPPKPLRNPRKSPVYIFLLVASTAVLLVGTALLVLGWFIEIGWYEYLASPCVLGGFAIQELTTGWNEQARVRQYLLNKIGRQLASLNASL